MAKNLCNNNQFAVKLKQQMDQVLKTVGIQKGAGEVFKRDRTMRMPLPSSKHNFTVYKLDGCPYSTEAGELVAKIPSTTAYAIFEDLQLESKEQLRDFLHENTSFDKGKHATFPIVFAGSTFIGGCKELKQFLSSKDHQLAGGQRRRVSKKVYKRSKRSRRNRRRIS